MFLLTVCIALTSCATAPEKIQAQYVSPLQYETYTCQQISAELSRIGVRVAEVAGQQRKAANGDALTTGVGVVIFWPALFLLANNGDKSAELGRLKGEYEALQQTANTKNCGRAVEATPSQQPPH